jgi:hypothetical protein
LKPNTIYPVGDINVELTGLGVGSTVLNGASIELVLSQSHVLSTQLMILELKGILSIMLYYTSLALDEIG